MEPDMHGPEGAESAEVQSLILKIRRRDGDSADGQPTWHGQVTSVPSGRKLYSNDPNELLIIVASQLRTLGVRLAACWRLRVWLRERRQRTDRGES